MSDKTDPFPPPSKQPVQPAGSNKNESESETLADTDAEHPHEGNGSTGDQIGGQSRHSEAEMEGRIGGLPQK